jgi:hypothetical protein
MAVGIESLGFLTRPFAADLYHHRLRRLSSHIRGDDEAARSVPRAALFGYLFLCAFILMVPSLDEAAKGLERLFLGLRPARQSVIKEIIYLVVFVAQLLCGLATVTSASRMIFAFARDRGLPGSKALAHVSPKYRTPVAGDMDCGGAFRALCMAQASDACSSRQVCMLPGAIGFVLQKSPMRHYRYERYLKYTTEGISSWELDVARTKREHYVCTINSRTLGGTKNHGIR